MQKSPNIICRTWLVFSLWPSTSVSNQARTTGFTFAIWQMLSKNSTPSPLKTVALELLPQFCFRSYRKETRVRLHLLKDLLTSQASLAGILQTAAPFHSAMLYVCFPDPTWSVAIKSVYLIYKTCWNVVLGKKSQVHETSIILRSRGQQITLFWQKYFSVLFIIQVCLS